MKLKPASANRFRAGTKSGSPFARGVNPIVTPTKQWWDAVHTACYPFEPALSNQDVGLAVNGETPRSECI
jgi:hypothetical protein